ncbi:MAG: DUF2723 domain-containing protein [Anaerolineae bacterium]|nr:DUF2723 domain-containing protein [Anaerolineae bacterium]MDH7474732.1 DUF2723 domain-containing protein [Anaerolineae bacterium]
MSFKLTLPALFVLAAGLTAGAFLSRLLSESFYAALGGLARWPGALLFAGAGGLTALGVWALAARVCNCSGGAGPRRAATISAIPAIPFFLLTLYLLSNEVNLLQGWTLLIGALTLAALLAGQSALRLKLLPTRRADMLLPFILTLGTFALYLRTLSPTIGQADSFEFQVVAYTLGVAHPTGYPLYILLGKLFTFLPIGDMAYRVNLTSPVCASLAALFLYLCVCRLTRSRWAALCAALTFAFARTLWSQAVIAEVYTLNVLFVALALYLMLRWRDGHAASLRLLAFILGLSLTNHLTMVLLLPAVLIFIIWTKPGTLRQGRLWLGLAGLFLLGLAVYLYIPLRWPALHQGRLMRLDEFVAWVTGRQFSGALRWDAWLRDPGRYGILARLSLEQYGVAGLLLGLLGLVWLLIRPPREGFTLLVAYVAYSFYGLNYYVPDISVFLIPAQAIHAVCIGVGAWVLAKTTTRLAARVSGTTVPAMVWTLVMLLPLSLVWTNLPAVDRSSEWASRRWGEAVLQLPIAQGAAILADSDKIAPLYYLNRVEGVRPDLEPIVRGDEAGYYQDINTRLPAGQTVYLARFLPHLEGAYHLRSLGPLVEVSTTPLTTSPSLDYPLDVAFGEHIRLLGFNADTLTARHDQPMGLTLFWQAMTPVPMNYHVRLRLVSASGRVWWESAGHPVSGLYPTAAWKPPEVIPDYHEVVPDASLPPGDYCLEVGLFPPFAQQGLPIADTGESYLTLSTVHLEAATIPAVAHPRRVRFGDNLLLLGYDHPATARSGTEIELILVWQQLRPGPDFDLVFELVDENGQIISESASPFHGEYPPSRWPVGSSILDRQILAVPETPGIYQVRVGLRTSACTPILARCGWLAPATQTCSLGSIRVQSFPLVTEAIANFDGQILLLKAELGRQQLHPGEKLPITLTWQGQRKMSEDYTLFIHLLDEQGQLRGQIDVWPRDGTYPTSLWVEGEMFSDTYDIPLDPDAPSGAYQVEIGWYLLRTMQRLPVLDAGGQAIDDKVLIPGLKITPQ